MRRCLCPPGLGDRISCAEVPMLGLSGIMWVRDAGPTGYTFTADPRWFRELSDALHFAKGACMHAN